MAPIILCAWSPHLFVFLRLSYSNSFFVCLHVFMSACVSKHALWVYTDVCACAQGSSCLVSSSVTLHSVCWGGVTWAQSLLIRVVSLASLLLGSPAPISTFHVLGLQVGHQLWPVFTCVLQTWPPLRRPVQQVLLPTEASTNPPFLWLYLYLRRHEV